VARATKETYMLSFVDVLSCGLGAAVLLFLVYSALPHHVEGDAEGGRNLKGQSFTPQAPVGSVKKRPGRGNTVAIRVVEIAGGDELASLALRWTPIPTCTGDACCVPYRGRSESTWTFALACPAGFGPEKLQLQVESGVAGLFTVRAHAIDGADVTVAEEKIGCPLSSGAVVTFQLDNRKRPIRTCSRTGGT
jgi:hypothetical protein